MNKVLTLATLLLFAIHHNLLAQSCGTIPSTPFVEQVKEIALLEDSLNYQTANRSSVTLGVKFWDLHGTNITSNFTNSDIQYYIGVLNSKFNNIGVSFELCSDLQDISDNQLASFDYGSGFQDQYMYNNCYDAGLINIYLVYSSNGGSYAEFPQSTRLTKNALFLDKGTLVNHPSFLPIHEMGHFFGLFHTWGNGSHCSGTDELPDGSNSSVAGDIINDTPADPGLSCSNDRHVNQFCVFQGSNGFEVYHPLTDNFMSYNYDAPHCVDKFTSGQIARMSSFVFTRQNLVCQSGGADCGDPHEYNDNKQYATFLGNLGNVDYDNILHPKISRSNDLDYFKATFTVPGNFRVLLAGLPADFDIKLYANDQQIGISQNSGTDSDLIEFPITDISKTYYLVVYGANSQTYDCGNVYDLIFRWRPNTGNGGSNNNCDDNFEPNNTFFQAKPFGSQNLGSNNFNGTIYPRLAHGTGDADYFKVITTQFGTLDFVMSGLSSDYDLDLFFYDGNQNLIFFQEHRGSPTEQIIYIGAAGTYYIVVKPGPGVAGVNLCDYSLSLNWLPSGSGGGGSGGGGYTGFCSNIPDQNYEPNGSISDAYDFNQFVFGQFTTINSIYGNITSPSDEDFYKVVCNVPGQFRFDLDEVNNIPDLRWYLLDNNGNIIFDFPASNSQYRFANLGQETVYIRIVSPNGNYNCTGDYRFQIAYSPFSGGGSGGGGNNNPCNPLPDANAEPNEDFANAFYNPQLQNITQGGTDITMSSYISSTTDVDVYRLELSLDGMLRFEYCAPQNLNATFEVFNSSGNKINNVSIGNCTDWSMLLYNAGTYYVKIKAQNGAFNCSEPYTFRFTFTASPSGGGGGNTNPWDCSEAIDLPVNNEVYCGPLASDYCPVYTFGSNINKPNRTPNYNCSPVGNFGGGEKLYKVTKPYDGYCCTGLEISLNIANGNPSNWAVHLYDNCDLSNCINNSNQITTNNTVIFQFNNIPTGDYFVLIDVQNGQESDYTILANCMREITCPVILNHIDPNSIVIDYSDQNQDCSCGNIQNPTIQSGNFSCITSTTLTAEAICTSGFEIQWFNSLSSTIPISAGQSFQVTQPGLYFAESVQISTGCKSERIPVVVEPPNIPVSLTINNTTCGSNNGEVQISSQTPNLSYLWSNGQFGSNLQNIGAGTYSVTITDTNGCSVTRSAYVGGANLKVQIFKQEDDCAANPNKLIQAFANGNSPIVGFLWSTGDTISSINSTAFGTYSVTVTDIEGCTASASVQVENKSFSTLPYITQPSCKGMSNGSVALSAFYGVPPIQYQWSNGIVASEIDNLPKGDYMCTVTDARGCEIVDTIQVTEPDSMIFHVLQVNPTCGDSTNGEISVFVEGGTRFYNYQWDNGNSENRLQQIGGGIYTLTVTDWNNCVSSANITLIKPDTLAINATATSVPCSGLPTGSISLQTSGGTLPYSYLWQSGDTLSSLVDLMAGLYVATITDANGCNRIISSTITEPNAMNLQINTVNVSCYGGNNGSITVTPNGGVQPYNIAFNSGNGSILTAGNYIVTVTDANNCPVYDTVSIMEPSLLSIDVNKTDVSCAGLSNGSVVANTIGGTMPYSFDWLGSNSTNHIANNLSVGTVTLIVTDANNCKDTIASTITEPTALAMDFVTESESCAGKSDGSASLNVNGGILPYQIQWGTGSNATTLNNIQSGTYQVTITDANNCTKTGQVTVDGLPPLTFEISPIPTTCSYTDDGALLIDTIIGVAPYTINIDNDLASNTQYFENVLPGQHQMFITDANNCIWSKDFEIIQPLPIDGYLEVSNDSILMGETVELNVVSDNYLLTDVLWQPAELVNCATCPAITTQPFYNQRYKVIIKNDAGCEELLEQMIKVSRERPIFAPNVFSPNSDINNDHFTIYGAVNAIEIKHLRVFDRWGNLLFERKNFPPNTPELGWDGTFRGKVLDAGVYIYSAEIEFVDKQILKYQGDVSILR